MAAMAAVIAHGTAIYRACRSRRSGEARSQSVDRTTPAAACRSPMASLLLLHSAGQWRLLLGKKEHTMEIDSLKKLYVDELKDLYSAEKQILQALPKMVKKATNPQLKDAFQDHLKVTEGHVERLERIFEALGKPARGKKCKAMEGLLEEGKEVMAEDMAEDVMDAALISAAQRVEHYEMAGYGTVRTWAELLGESTAAKLLQQTLDEEGNADKSLTQLAETTINVEAMAGV
jgi:ferritin-like metal-binding protein YciE